MKRVIKVLTESVERYHFAMKTGDYTGALSHADQIRDIGLQYGSEAWNTAMDEARLKIKKTKSHKKD